MRRSLGSECANAEQSHRRWSGLGLAGFSFFLLKGLLWLLTPVLISLWR